MMDIIDFMDKKGLCLYRATHRMYPADAVCLSLWRTEYLSRNQRQ